jgi:hypothetical protein
VAQRGLEPEMVHNQDDHREPAQQVQWHVPRRSLPRPGDGSLLRVPDRAVQRLVARRDECRQTLERVRAHRVLASASSASALATLCGSARVRGVAMISESSAAAS